MNSTSLNVAEKALFNPHLSCSFHSLPHKALLPRGALPLCWISFPFSSIWQYPTFYRPNSSISYYAMPFLDYSQANAKSPSVYYLVFFYYTMTVYTSVYPIRVQVYCSYLNPDACHRVRAWQKCQKVLCI